LRVILGQLGECIRFEEFAGLIVCTGLELLGHFPDGAWTDEHTTALVQVFESVKLYVSPAVVERAVALHARKNSYNVVTDFFAECANAWDGVPRVAQALATYWNAPDDNASRAVSRVLLLSLAARGITPGAKVDTCPVFIGDQGERKSSSLEALVGPAWFSDSPLPIGEKDGMQNLAGVLLWEFSEGESLTRKERNANKAFLSSRIDKFRASYDRHKKAVPRQTCFIATTNDAEVLTDPTGARRFLPVHVRDIDVKGIKRDRVQLLGEAAHRVGVLLEEWWETPAEKLALAPVREACTERHPWHEPIAAWLRTRTQPFLMGDIFHWEQAGPNMMRDASKDGPIPMNIDRIGKREQAWAAGILRTLKYERKQDRTQGPNRGDWFWAPRAPDGKQP
jgi:predicted P-loop ATPase